MNNVPSDITELNGEDIYPEWENLLRSDKAETPATKSDDFSLDNLMVGNDENMWVERFRKHRFLGMQLIALHTPPVPIDLDLSQQHTIIHVTRHAFLTKLPTTHLNDLRIAGLTEEDIAAISKGIVPVNWTVHLKYPLQYGGQIEPDNMVLMPQYPFHEQIHAFLNQQMVTDAGVITPTVLYVPTPTNNVYVPIAGQMDDMAPQHITLGGAK